MFHQYRRIVLLLSGLLLAAAAIGPLAVRSALPELGVERPQETADWQLVEAEGFRLRLPPTWFEITSEGHILGVGSGQVAAPGCAERAGDGCRADDAPPLTLRWQVERAENRSTPAGDEIRAIFERRGFAALAVTMRALPATLFTASAAFGGVDQVVILEHAGVYYRLWLSEGLATTSQGDLGALILGTVEFTPDTAPPPWFPDAPADPTPTPTDPVEPAEGAVLYLPMLGAGQASPANHATAQQAVPQAIERQNNPAPQAAFVNPEAVAAYAELYAYPPGPGGWRNSDNCYVYTNQANTSSACAEIKPTITTGRDGAHFMDCALEAGGLDLGCDGNPRHPLVSMQAFYNTLTNPANPLAVQVMAAQARRGDILVMRIGNQACWGGVVTGRVNNQLRVATHSDDFLSINPLAIGCDPFNSTTRTYLRLNGDDAPPQPLFTAPAPGYIPPGALTLRYDATDMPANNASGVASFRLARSVEGGPKETLAAATTAREAALFADTPCRTVVFHLSAVDNAGNRSPEVTLQLEVGVWGDADADNDVDEADLAAAEAAWGRQRGEVGYVQALDVNADDRIDATDLNWVERHQGDRCQ